MAEAQPSTLTGAFGKPFDAQVAFFRQKLGNLVPTQWWDDLQKSEHDHGFMVAGAAKADLLADLAAAVDRAIAEGTGIEQFRKDFQATVARNGWTGWTGEDTAAGRAWRTRTIYVTNARTSYHAGRLAQLRSGGFPLWIYRHNDAVQHPRPLHVSWNGITLPPDHEFWQTHYTPNGWGCECYVVGARSPAAALRLGGNPSKELPEGWDDIDPKTGEPPGVDKGWGYMPGSTVSDAASEMAGKAQGWADPIAKAYMRDVPDTARDTLSTAYRALPSVADDVRRYAQRVDASSQLPSAETRTLGLVTSKQVSTIQKATGQNVTRYDYALEPASVRAALSTDSQPPHGQRAATLADFAALPTILNADSRVVTAGTARGERSIQMTSVVDGQTYLTVWALRPGLRSLVLQAFWLLDQGA